jgi:hypothetical protein
MKQQALIAAAIFLGGVVAAPVHATEINIDRYEVKSSTVPAGATILFKDFSVENTDFGKMQKDSQKQAVDVMKNTAPMAFREAFVRKLSEDAPFAAVVVHEGGDVPAGSLLVEGEFTALNPGSRTKRYLVGMGAGRSKICIAGHVVNADGEELLKFEDCRSGNLGWFGGRSEGMMSQDVYLSADNLADFVTVWAKQELPTLVTKKRPK